MFIYKFQSYDNYNQNTYYILIDILVIIFSLKKKNTEKIKLKLILINIK